MSALRLVLVASCLLKNPGASLLAGSSVLEQFTLKHWNVEDGLPEAKILQVQQAPDGYLWLTTPHHLVRFDGLKFLTLPAAALPPFQGELRQFQIDRQGRLWLCAQAELYLHDGHRWQPVPVLAPTNVPAGAPVFIETPDGRMQMNQRLQFFSVGDDEFGQPLLATSAGVFVFDDGRMRPVPPPPDAEGRTPLIIAAAFDTKGAAWLVRDGRLWKFRDGKYSEEIFPDELRATGIFRVAVANSGAVWAQQLDGRIFRRENSRWEEVPPAGLRVSAVLEAADGESRWIGSAEALHLWRHGNWQAVVGLEEDTPTDTRCLAQSRDGCVWVGTGWGVYRLQPRTVQLLPVSMRGGSSLPALCVVPTETNSLLVGLKDGGVWAGGVDGFQAETTNAVLRGSSISALWPSDRRLWMGTRGNHLWYFEADHSSHQSRQLEGLQSRFISCLLEDRQRRLWAGTREGLLLQNSSMALVSVTRQIPVLCLGQANDDSIWVGTQGGGLWRVGTKGIVEEFHRRDGLPSETIRFVQRDAQGVVWLGTPSGLARLDDHRLTAFGLKQGLPDEDILQLLDDGAGNLWLGTRRGVLRVAKSELPARANGPRTIAFQLYGHNDGLTANLTADDSSPLATSTPDGCLWFCTEQGLARVDPRVTRQAIQAGSLKIDAVQIGEKVVSFPGPLLPGRAVLTGNADGREIKIAPGTQEAGIVYSLPTFAAPEDALFQTWLEGFDSGWSAPSARRVAVYSRLPAGTYRFHLRGSAGGGIWTELPEPLTLAVGAFFYETVWFKSLIGLLVLGFTGLLVGVAVRQRARKKYLRLQREQAHELAVEAERSRIARDIHDDLGATLTQIAMLSEAAQSESAAGKPPARKLTDIFDRARSATRQLDEIIWAIDPGNDTLEHLVGYLCQFASDYLTLAGLKFRFDSPELLPARSLSSAQRHHLFLAARETLHNVVKHAGATEVWLRVRFENETLHLTIEDDGTGSGQTPAATGHGTANIASRMNELGGSVLRRAAAGGGTVVELILPLPPPPATK